MFEIRQSDEFIKWVRKLKDRNAKARIDTRLRRMELGFFVTSNQSEKVLAKLEYHTGQVIASTTSNIKTP